MEHLLKDSWEDDDHSDFYRRLRDLPQEEQSKLVLMQASQLTKIADHKNTDLLKAAESLVNFWIIHYANSTGEKGKADYLLDHIHQTLKEINRTED